MNKLVELVLKANIVPANAVHELERWGLLDRGTLNESMMSKTPLYDRIKVLEDIGNLLEEELTRIKETKLEIPLQDLEVLLFPGKQIPAYKDEMGRFVVAPSTRKYLSRGLSIGSIRGKDYTLLGFDELYNGDTVIALILITRME